ncbi:MAG: glycosyltransferase family 2 protein [Thermoguttaceae bacterium]|nr:glycosyltransferase family 2 protein [Thermoguttaceae bacterium]
MPTYITGLVSVVIPTRGRSNTLVRSVQSVLKQTYTNLEVLIVDDNDGGSELSDWIKHLINDFADTRVKLVQQMCHINGAAARNAGIKVACGEYIAFLDDDDWWEPEKLELQVNCLSSLDETYGLVTCMMKFYLKGDLKRASLPYKDGFICREVASRCFDIGIGAPLIRRIALDETGYFDERLCRMQDIQLFTFLCSRYKVFLLKKYLYCICGDDDRNRKNLNVSNVKENFIRSIQSVLNTMSDRDRLFIRAMQNFDMGYSFLKARKYNIATPLILNVFKNFEVLKYAVSRVVVRIKERYLRFYNLRKYNK